jgi:hypothetical protein
MFDVDDDDGAREPAAKKLYDESYVGQNASDDTIPLQSCQQSVLSMLIADRPFSPSRLFRDGVVAKRVPSPGLFKSNTSIASSKPQYNLTAMSVVSKKCD